MGFNGVEFCRVKGAEGRGERNGVLIKEMRRATDCAGWFVIKKVRNGPVSGTASLH